MKSPTIFLMYHELELPGRTPCRIEPGYLRYVLPMSVFESQLHWLSSSGLAGVNVSQALKFQNDSSVCLTFDDGSETDLLTAAPLLQRFGFGATFYVTAGFLGKRGYLSPTQLRELSRAGFEIGCHSMTHAYISDLQGAELDYEVLHPKMQLENILGKSVEHFSCPGGRYNGNVQRAVKQAQYLSLSTSRLHPNAPSTDRFQLGRVAVTRNMDLQTFQRVCRNQSLWKMRAVNSVRSGTRRVIGNSAYDAIRRLLLGRHPSTS